jgi:acetyl-CoA carboxylase biotin carboxyl carrier protein
MDLRKLNTLIELVESSGIAELEISEGEERVRITRTAASTQQTYTPTLSSNIAAAAPAQASTPAAAVEPVKPAVMEG